MEKSILQKGETSGRSALFPLGLPVTKAAHLPCLSVRSVNTIYQKIFSRLVDDCALHNPFAGKIEVDESYFGLQRIRGQRGRGFGLKKIVSGILTRNG